jgi:high-affinity Fe2+/Pb2+ permease
MLTIHDHKGAGILSSASKGKKDNTTLGQDTIIAGLLIQILAFGVFVAVGILFHKRMHERPTQKSMVSDMPWQKYLYVIYIVSLLILVRSLVRLIEYAQGYDGYVLSHEVFLYLFDGTFMLIVLVIFNFVHPRGLQDKTQTFNGGSTSLERMRGSNV